MLRIIVAIVVLLVPGVAHGQCLNGRCSALQAPFPAPQMGFQVPQVVEYYEPYQFARQGNFQMPQTVTCVNCGCAMSRQFYYMPQAVNEQIYFQQPYYYGRTPRITYRQR